MTRQQKVLEKKKRGRPAIGKGAQVNMQLRPEHAAALDEWRNLQSPPVPSRAQAARIAIEEWLAGLGLLKAKSDQSPQKLADTIEALDAEHAVMDPKPSPKKALNRMKAAITKDVQKKGRPKT